MSLWYWLMRLPCRLWNHQLYYMRDGKIWCYDEGRRVG